MFPEDGEGCDDGGCAFGVTVLDHDVTWYHEDEHLFSALAN